MSETLSASAEASTTQDEQLKWELQKTLQDVSATEIAKLQNIASVKDAISWPLTVRGVLDKIKNLSGTADNPGDNLRIKQAIEKFTVMARYEMMI